MKIAIVSPMLLPVSKKGGAVEQLILNIVRENEKQENPIYIDLYAVASSYREKYQFTTIHQIKLPKWYRLWEKTRNLFYKIIQSNKRYEMIVKKTALKIAEKKYDLIIVENRMGLYKAIYQGYPVQVPFYFHLHNDLGDIDKTAENYLFIEKTCQKIFTVSNYIKEQISNVKPSKKIEVLYNCIDTDYFNSNNVDSYIVNKLRDRYHLNYNFIYGFVGRITPEKGVLELIRAFKQLCLKHNDIKLLIVGTSWFDTKKPSLFEQLLIDETNNYLDKIIFTGYINYSEIREYYKICDVIVNPSNCNEAFGLVALETMGLGIPLITTDAGGLKEVIESSAFLIPREDMQEKIYQAIDLIYRNDSLLKQLSEQEKIHVQAKMYSQDQFYNQWCNLIR